MAAKGRKISGIYVPIQLDTQQINQDIERLNTKVKSELGSIAAAMSQSLDSALNPRKLIGNFSQLIQGLGNVRDAASALQSLKPFGNFDRALGSNVITPQLRELAQTLGITEQAQRKLLQQMAKNTAIQTQVNGLRQLERTMGTTRKETVALAQSLGMLLDKAAKTQYLGSQGRGILGAFSPSNMTAGIQSAMGAMGVVGGMYGVVELGKSMTQAALKMENVNIAFESIYGSADKAGTQLQFIKQVSDTLGLSFLSTADSGRKLFAAINDTDYAKDANKVFLAFSNAGAALKLSQDEMQSIFLAVSQIYSKGKVSAEELRQQLAERLPGAVTLFAKSIGVTTKELDKMLQDGAVGLEHMGKFADALQEKYGAAAVAASKGLQAELNRVSNAWLELKTAFVNTDSLAEGVRAIGSALGFLAKYAPAISTVVIEFTKFAALTGSIYGLGKGFAALNAQIAIMGGGMAALRTGFAGFVGVMTRLANPLLLVSMSLGGALMAVIKMETQMSDAEKVIRQYSSNMEDLANAADEAGRSFDELSEKEQKIKLDRVNLEVEKAAKAVRDIFNTPASMELPTGVIDAEVENMLEILDSQAKSGIDIIFDNMRSLFTGENQNNLLSEARGIAERLGGELNKALREKMSAEEFAKIWDEARLNLLDTANKLEAAGATDEAAKAFGNFINVLHGAANEYENFKSQAESYGKKQEKVTDIVKEAQTAFESIQKLTKSSALGKENKQEANMRAMVSGLYTLQQSALDASRTMEELGDSADKSGEQWLGLQNRVEQFEKALPLVASQAIKNGQDFETMATSIYNAGLDMQFTTEQLYAMYDAMRVAFSVEIGKQIEKDLDKLAVKTQMIGAKTADSKAFELLSKWMGKNARESELYAAVVSKDNAKIQAALQNTAVTIEHVDKVMKGSELFGSAKDSASARKKSRGARLKTARSQMTEFAKEIGSVEKKIASLQSKYDDDPSIKYWADVRGELEKIDNILTKGAGTATEKQRLTELRAQYEQLAKDRARQMAEEERRQKAIEAASKFGRGYGNLSDVSGAVNSEMQVAAFQAEYEQMVIDWNKALDDQTVSYEQYAQGIADLTNELQVKTDSANGSMVANFTDHINQSYEQIKDWQSEVSDILMTGVTSMSDAFAEFFITNINDTKSLEEAFGNMVQSMIKSLAQLFMQMIIIGTLKKALGFFGGDGESGYEQVMSLDMSKFIPSAKGNVFSGGNISKYSNSVVTAPTTFSYASHKAFGKGGGIMGERGPEAVVPLIRTRGGNLGVRAEGGFGSGQQALEMNQAISINIINNTDSKVSAKRASDSNGNLNIQVMIEKMVADSLKTPGSPPFRVMQNEWQGATKLASRG